MTGRAGQMYAFAGFRPGFADRTLEPRGGRPSGMQCVAIIAGIESTEDCRRLSLHRAGNLF
jgi:hypothetical protein